MLVLGIRYLSGVAVASHGTRDQVEWPPHPARVFMALVAAHYQTGADPVERQALLALENLREAPTIHAAGTGPRSSVDRYVPVNDNPALHVVKKIPGTNEKKVVLYPEIHGTALRRNRQPRSFACAWLESDLVFLSWPTADLPAEALSALAALCGKVTRIGHSSSLVQMWLAEPTEIPPDLPRWEPDNEHATHALRVACPGALEELERRFRLHQWPQLSVSQGYLCAAEAAAEPIVRGSVFNPHLLVFLLHREESPYRTLDLTVTLTLTGHWRDALLKRAAGAGLSAEARQCMSGHDASGRRLEQPHAAFLPLPVVGHAHADGHLMGVALALPWDLSTTVRLEVLQLANQSPVLGLGRLGKWRLERLVMARPPVTLRDGTWTAHPHGATHWGSVTPFVFDYHPREKPSRPTAPEPGLHTRPSTEVPPECRQRRVFHQEAADLIADACQRVGLPRPREVIVSHMSAHFGVPPAPAFPRLRRKDGTVRCHTHAVLVFDQPVAGPVLLGAGRYRGYGFFRPMEAVP